VQALAGVGVDVARSALQLASGTVRGSASSHARRRPRCRKLARLDRIQPHTRVSMALLLDEQTERRPDATAFVFDDRAHTRAATKHRLDSVAAGLLESGVRQGDHVGVLMGTRPSAMVLVGALNGSARWRFCFAGRDLQLEARLGRITRVVTDPEHAAAGWDSTPKCSSSAEVRNRVTSAARCATWSASTRRP